MKIRKATQPLVFTSSFCGYINATYNELFNVFGGHHCDDGEKISAEWELELVDGTVFSIYDWKECYYPFYNRDEKYEWHIGTETMEDTLKVIEVLKDVGLNAFYTGFYKTI